MTETFIKKAILVHGDKYDYSKVEYKKAIKNVIIICKKHGEFLQQPNNHLTGNECTKCSILRRSDKSRYTTEIFIDKAKEINGELYDYSNVNYVDSKTKVIIICKEHGEFLQAPNKHLQKHKCPKCMCREKRNNEEFIEKAKEIHGDKYDYSKIEYSNSQTKIIIICNNHGEFLQIPNSHIQGMGCIKCANVHKSNTEDFIIKATEIHKDLYDYSKVKYVNSHTKIIIICKEHGEFEQTPSDHLNCKYGCQICSMSIRGETKMNNCKEKFITNAIKIHGDIYDYSKSIYTGCENKLIIICKEHGEFEQQPNNHLYGKGCYNCGRTQVNDSRRSNLDEFLKKAVEIHKDLYDYSKVEYVNNHTKVEIICKEHGEFEQTPSHHLLREQGCYKCGEIRTANSKYSNTNEFIEKSKKIHGDKYDYSNVNYKKANENVNITCKEHGIFSIRPNNHINSNQGCVKCQIKKQYSKKSIDWLNFISKYYNINIQHGENGCEFKIPNTRYRADGYCMETNTIYEFNGTRWHGDPRFCDKNETSYFGVKYGELYEKTIKKGKIIKDMGFNLITIWEYDWDKINKSIKILQKNRRLKCKKV